MSLEINNKIPSLEYLTLEEVLAMPEVKQEIEHRTRGWIDIKNAEITLSYNKNEEKESICITIKGKSAINGNSATISIDFVSNEKRMALQRKKDNNGNKYL